MKKVLQAFFSFLLIVSATTTFAQAPSITYQTPQTYTAGTAITALTPVNTGGAVPAGIYGQVTSLTSGTNYYSPAIVMDTARNIYYYDNSAQVIRKVSPTGVVGRFAGSGAVGSTNGTGSAASFNSPQAFAIDAAGYIYVADTYNNLIRKVSPYGVVTTLAGSGSPGATNGTGAAASFDGPQGIAVDATGNVYVSDANNELIRKITPGGNVSTFAGSGSAGSSDGTGPAASFYFPLGLAVDAAGNVYVADANNATIRKITPARVVSTIAGTAGNGGFADGNGPAAMFNYPSGVAADALGNVYVADQNNGLIRKITPAGAVTTLAGKNGLEITSDGAGTAAGFDYPLDLVIDPSGYLYVAESSTLIRKVSTTGYLNPILPPGLYFDPLTGGINGTPVLATPATNYTVTGYNVKGSSTATINITITGNLTPPAPPVNAPVLSYSSPQNYTVGTAITPLTPANTGGIVPGGLYGQTTTVIGGTGAASGVVVDAAGNIYFTYSNQISKINTSGTVSIFAGSGNAGSANGQGLSASFNSPYGLAIDASGNIYVADGGNNLIRKITAAGLVSTVAGSGAAGRNDGTGITASFSNPQGIAVDAFGSLFITDANNRLIRKISQSGLVSTLAGSGASGNTDGAAALASFASLGGIAVDALDNAYAVDISNNSIRKITPAGVVSTLAGGAGAGYADGTGTAALFSSPQYLTIDVTGNLYVTDLGQGYIRKVSPAGVVTTVAGGNTNYTSNGTGSAAGFSSPQGIAIDAAGNLFLADASTIRKVSAVGYSIKPALSAGLFFNELTGSITGTPVVAATANYTITGYNLGGNSTANVNIAASGSLTMPPPPVSAPILSYSGSQSYTAGSAITPLPLNNTGGAVPGILYGQTITLSPTTGAAKGIIADAAHNVYVTDAGANVIRKITPAGTSSIFAGTGTAGFANGQGTAASFNSPQGLAIDGAGNLYVSDAGNNAIRKIAPDGTVTTVAGNGSSGRNDGTGQAASFSSPAGITIDIFGTLYVSDAGNQLIRKISPAGAVSTFAGSGAAGYADGNGTAAVFSNPLGITVDAVGNLFVADNNNLVIRKITPAGVVSTLAGTAGNSGAADGTGAAASFSYPVGISIDAAGNLYVTDANNYLVRRITSAGVVSTIAGNAALSSTDGTGSSAGFNYPQGIVYDASGFVFVADNGPVRKVSVTGYRTSPALPPGLVFDSSTGIISGTPTFAKAATTYTVSGFNAGGSSVATVGITVTGTATLPAVVAAPVVTYSTPQTYTTGTSITPLLPSNSGGAIPANMYGQVTTFAGSGAAGANDGTGVAASFNSPLLAKTDPFGNLYVADVNNYTIRKISPSGVVTTLAGSGGAGYADATGTAAIFSTIYGLAIDAAGNVYVADGGNEVIRKITPLGVVTTLAGTAGQTGSSNGTGAAASFTNPRGLAVDASGNIYVADKDNELIRKITPAGAVTTYAGNGNADLVNGTGTAASFNSPNAIAIDASGNLYVTETNNYDIRKITTAKVVTTFAGNGTSGNIDGSGAATSFNGISDVTIDDAGNLYVADAGNQLIRKVTKTGVVSTLAGAGPIGVINGIGTAAGFANPTGVGLDKSGNLYVVDNGFIRKVVYTGYNTDNALPAGLTLNTVTGAISGTPTAPLAAANYVINGTNAGGSSAATVNITITGNAVTMPPVTVPHISYTTPQNYTAGTTIGNLTPANTGGAVPAQSYAKVSSLPGSHYIFGIAADASGNIYFADYSAGVIKKMDQSGVASLIAGNGNSGASNGKGTAASFSSPRGMVFDAQGNLYVADQGNNQIRKVSPSGVVSTFAGSTTAGSANGTGTSARFNAPFGIAIDANGNLYVADQGNNLIRKITPAGVVTTLAGNTAGGSADGTGPAASFSNPAGVTVDATGNIYIADQNNYEIRKITPAGAVTTFAGSTNPGNNDGTGASASFSNPLGLTIDAIGNLYVTDTDNGLIRKITPAGVVSTIAGNSTLTDTDGIGTAASFGALQGITADALGNLYAGSQNAAIRKISLTGYTYSGTIPAGLTFDTNTGIISGTPTVAGASTINVTAYNTGGSSSTSVSITVTGTITPPVNPVTAPNISYATPQTYAAGTTISSLAPANAGGAVPAMTYGQTTTYLSGINFGYGLVTDASGNVYYTGGNNVYKATPAGANAIFAGNSSAGFINDTRTAASFNNPQGLAIDASGNIYVADYGNNAIRKITPAGVVSTPAGNGAAGRADGPGASAGFNGPQAVAVDSYGNVYVSDATNNLIRKIGPTGIVSTLAGNGTAGYANGNGTAASFSLPQGVAVDGSGNIFVVDQGNQVIRKITPAGLVSTFAGTAGTTGSANGTGAAASFSSPVGLSIDAAGNLFVADQNNQLIRKITSAGVVTTLAGNGTAAMVNGIGATASFYYPVTVAADGLGNVYVGDYYIGLIRKISAAGYSLNNPTLPAGLTFDPTTGTITGTPVLATAAKDYSVSAYNTGGSSTTNVNITVTGTITPPVNPVSAPVISYATPQNYTAGNAITNLNPANSGGAVPAMTYGQTTGFLSGITFGYGLVADAAGNVYYTGGNQIFKATQAGPPSVFAGNTNTGFINNIGTAASFNNPQGLAIDAAGNVYVADYGNNAIRKITSAGAVTTFAGSGSAGLADGPGASASFNGPQALAVDSYGNVYVSDANNNLIRKISPAGIVSTLAGSGTSGYTNGLGTAASFSLPQGVAVDGSGNVFVVDQGNQVIRKITPAGLVSTFAGTAGTTGSANGTGTAASFSSPIGLSIDAAGNLFVADQNNQLIRKITSAGVVTTLAGNGTAGFVNGIGATATFYYPVNVAADGLGNVYVGDYYSALIRKISAVGYALNNPPLPAGLAFDANTGIIQGTPILAATAKDYSVSAYNLGGSSTFNVNITVTGTATPPAAPTVPAISYATPQTYAVGIPIAALSPTNTGGAIPPMIYSQVGSFVGGGAAGHNDGNGAVASFNITAEGNIATDLFGNIYVADAGNHVIRRITPAGLVTTFAGSGTSGSANGTGTAASFGDNIAGIAVDKNNNVYVADQYNQTIRKITPAGVVTTLAGTLGVTGSDNGAGTVSTFNYPEGIAVDKSGNVYVADNSNFEIRKITPAGSVSTLAGSPGGYGSDNGNGASATFGYIRYITIDGSGNLYVADNQQIRKITSSGVVSSFAGTVGVTGFNDGTGTGATFSSPSGLTTDAGGNVYVADAGNYLLRKITPAGVVTTIAGNGAGAIVNGTGSSASFLNTLIIAADNFGNLYATDGAGGNFIRKISLNGYTNSAPFPSGLSFDSTTGILTGTPTVASAATTYSIKGNNSAGTSTASLNITVIYPPAVATSSGNTAFASMGDVTPVPVAVDPAVTATDLSRTTLASGTVSLTTNFNAAQDVLAFTNVPATMGNIAGAYNASTGVLSLTSSGTTATVAQWQAALQSVTYNNTNNVNPSVLSRTVSFLLSDGTFSSFAATKTIGLTYTPSHNAHLSNLIISAGTLSPVFAQGTTTYSANVSNSVSSVNVTATTVSHNATMTINGAAVVSGTAKSVPLSVGNNVITTTVLAQDLTTTITYTLNITRAATQTITFAALNPVTYGAADFSPGATSTNNTIPITYASSNAAVATIVGGNIHVVGVGTSTITASQAGNINFDPAPSVTQTLTVNKAALTITADNKSKNYGTANPTLTVSYAGFVNSETSSVLTTQPTIATTAATGSPAGNYPITPSAAAAANYTISYVAGTLTVSPVSLTITAVNQSKTYGAANPAFTVTYNGFVNGDTQTSLSTQPTVTSTATVASPVGTYPITASGAVAASYNISYVAGTLTVGQASLTISADNQTKVYGAANPTLTASYNGFVNGDNAGSLTTQPTLSTTATVSSVPGSYPITVSGASATNYSISYLPGTLTVTSVSITFNPIPSKVYGTADFDPGATSSASITYTSSTPSVATIVSNKIHIVGPGTSTITANNGSSTQTQTLTVTAAPLTITANNQTKNYGAANPTLTVAYSGFVNGDTQSVLTTQPTVSTTATTASAAGTYPITATGAAAANYSITYIAGTLTVGKVALTITAANQAKTYGAANPTLTATYAGFVNGDTQTSLSTQPTITTTATATSVPGTYPITATGAASSNYTISYAAGTLTVSKAPLTITANSFTKNVGAANPTLTVSYAGFVNSETQSVLTTQPTIATTATASSPVGTYPITASGAAAANYTIAYVAGTLTVVSPIAAVPAISYPGPKVYTIGVRIATLSPSSTGGAVPANYYGLVSTVAGSGTAGSTNGTGTAASFKSPGGIATDAAGNIYVADFGNNLIRKISSAGAVTTFAGSGTAGAANGTGTAASFSQPSGITVDASGNLYVADAGNNLVRKITPAGVVTTFASGLNFPVDVAADASGNLYEADGGGSVVNKISPAGVVTVYSSGFSSPFGVAVDASGIVYVSDFSNRIYKVNTNGVSSVLAGSGAVGAANGTGTAATFNNPNNLKVDAAGYVYVGDTNNNLIRKISPTGVVTTLAGSGVAGGVNGIGALATFNGPYGIALDASNNVYVSDQGGNLIRKVINTGFAITPALPRGLAINSAGAISGTPTAASAATTYSIVASNNGGIVTATLGITVNGPPIISYLSPQTYTTGTTINTLTPTNTGGAVISGTYGQTTTFAGSTTGGSANGTGTAASFNGPLGLAKDPSGNIYVADENNNLIRKITAAGVVTTFAGSGAIGSANGTGTAASFYHPTGLASDGLGNIYVADQSNNLVRKITPTGVVTTFAGSGTAGFANGTGTAASFNQPTVIAVDGQGNLFVTDLHNNLIRKITGAGVVTTFAGSGTAGFTNGTGTAASFNLPTGITVDGNGNVFIADQGNHAIRKITSVGVVTTLAGNGTAGSANGTGAAASFYNPYAVAVDGTGYVYVADYNNNDVRVVTPGGGVNVLAGSTVAGSADGTGAAAGFNHPGGVFLDGTGNLFVADYYNNEIRKVALKGYSITPALPAGLAFNINTGTILGTPSAVKAATTYIIKAYNAGGASTANVVITVVAPTAAPVISYTTPQTYTTGTAITALSPTNTGGSVPATPYLQVSTLAGSGGTGSTNGTGTAASFNDPRGVVADASGNVYVADENNNLIRKITPAGVVTTFAGSGATGSADGTGTAASFGDPKGIAIDVAGNLYIGDDGFDLIRKITPAGVVTTLAGSGSQGFVNGTGNGASFGSVKGLAVDQSGNVFVADEYNNVIRKITPAGVVTTFAGSGATGTANGTGTAATFTSIIGLAIDASGNMFVTDNNLIRKITPAAVVTTLAGGAGGGVKDGTGAAASFDVLGGITIDKGGSLYVIDDNFIRKVTSAGVVTTLAGTAAAGSTNGTGLAASFNDPFGLTADASGNVYVGDTDNGLIRKIVITGYSITPALPAGLGFNTSTGVITGTPTAASAAKTYTVSAFNTGGSGKTTLSITVGNGLAFAAIPSKTYGTADFDPGATSGYAITYTSGSSAVATIVSGKIHIVGAGSSTITATSNGSSLNQTLTVTKAPLTITADNKTKTAGSPNPTLTVTYSGFVNSETQAVFTTQPTVNTTATTASVAGTYPITASSAAAANYSFTYVQGTLTVTASMHLITGNQSVNPPSNNVLLEDSVAMQPVVSPGMSPNGDGQNDYLTIRNIERYPDNKLTLVNRDGALIYEVAGYDNANKVFDGHSMKTRSMVLPGTYFYLLEYNDNGQQKRKTGFVVIKY